MDRWGKCCGWILRKLGWTSTTGPAPEDKCILLGAPHTSVWDFVIAYLYYRQFGESARCMVKKELFIWPLGVLVRKMGGIPTDRSNGAALLRTLTAEMEKSPRFHLAIALEGTRKPVKRWKSGYHFIAKATGATVYCCYFDWGTKRVGLGPKVELTDDAAADTRRIQQIYEDMHLVGKHPEKYITH